MTTAHNNNKFIAKIIKNLDLDLTTNKTAHDAVCRDVLITYKKSMKTKTTAHQQNIYRIIMKSPIIKLSAAAAVIIITVLSGIHYWPSLKQYHSNYNQQPVEQVKPHIPKNSIYAYSNSDEIQDDKDKEKEQTR